MKVIRFLLQFIPTIIVGIVILYLSLSHFTPSYTIPDIPNFDKIVHFTMYMGLVSVFCFDIYRSEWLSRYDGRILLWGWILAVLWGGLMELFQKYFTDYRTADWFDFLANTTGAFAGILIGVLIIRPFIKWAKNKWTKA
ncbi:VanZ family protein [Coprobacter sp.]